MASQSAKIDNLFAGLSGRPSPELVARELLALIDAQTLPERVRKMLNQSTSYRWSMMNDVFAPVVTPQHGADVLCDLLDMPRIDAGDRNALADLLARARAFLNLAEGRTDFKLDRANRAQRARAGLEISRRRYDKLFRLVARLEAELSELAGQTRLFRLNRFAKTAFAADMPRDRFSDPDTVAFVSWYSANLARRSLFTNGPQARAFDEVGESLFARLGDGADWFAVAHVFPRSDVLARLAESDRLTLLERSLEILEQSAAGLEAAALRTDISFETMTVAPGQDSSTWNTLAGAWNRARDYWIALVAAQAADELFESFMPGKALRLIAADVMSWHRSSGDTVHPDTPIFASLPRPWEILGGSAHCGRALVETICRANGVDPVKTGWSAARPRTAVDSWRLTPDTVHGVVVAHPALAAFLRNVGAFSGREIKPAGKILRRDMTPDGWPSAVSVADRDGLRPWWPETPE